MKRRLWLLMLFLFAGHVPAASADSACEGRFVNPITDICWSCIFPLSLGSIKVSQGSRPCDDGADRWSGVVCREIITPFLARAFFPDFLCLSSGGAGHSGVVIGMILTLILIINKQHNTGYL